MARIFSGQAMARLLTRGHWHSPQLELRTMPVNRNNLESPFYANENSEKVSNDRQSPSVAGRSAEFVLYSLFLLADALEVWPHSHLFALIFAVIGLIVLLVIDGALSVMGIAVVTAVAAVVCTVIYVVVPTETVPDVEVIGTLQPGNDPTPPSGCDDAFPGAVEPNALKIFIAGNAYFRKGFGKITAVEIGRDPNACQVLTVERTATGITVGAELYGENGQLMARISKGEFHAISGEHSHVERQGDLSTLVIKDASGKELLYVRYLNPTTVRARGVFGCPGHRPIAFTDTGMIGGMSITNSCMSAGRAAIHVD